MTQPISKHKLQGKMRCVEIREPGAAEVLKIANRPIPTPGDEEVLIKISAAGINRPDVLQRLGKYPPPPGASDIPGLEIAGEIVAVGNQFSEQRIGEQVCALVTGGGYAEYCVAAAPLALSVPSGLSMIAAAAIPETFYTVWTNVFQRGRLQAGEKFLVHGGSSGIGTTAIQLAKAFGAEAFTTVGNVEKVSACQNLGADLTINYREQDFVEVINKHTDDYGVDLILDMVGGDYINRNISLLAGDGRLVQIAFLKGSKTELDLRHVMMKRLWLSGSTLRARSVGEKQKIAEELKIQVWPLLEQEKIAPVIHQTFSLENAAQAHELMESNLHIGKIVLTTQ